MNKWYDICHGEFVAPRNCQVGMCCSWQDATLTEANEFDRTNSFDRTKALTLSPVEGDCSFTIRQTLGGLMTRGHCAKGHEAKNTF